MNCEWMVLDGSSAAGAIGDVVCLAGSHVTRATAAALSSAGAPHGILLTAGAPLAEVCVALIGALPPTVTGLPTSGNQPFARVNTTTARVETIASFTANDYALGTVEPGGNLSLQIGSGGSRIGNQGLYSTTLSGTTLLGSITVTQTFTSVGTGISQVGIAFPGDSIQFAAQSGVTYTIASVSAGNITLTGAYTGQSNTSSSNAATTLRNSNVATTGLLVLTVGGPTGPFSIDGLSTTASTKSGLPLVIYNTTAYQCTIVDQANSVSTAANQIICGTGNGQGVTLKPYGGSATLHYDTSSSRWRLQNRGWETQSPRYLDVREFGAVGDASIGGGDKVQAALNMAAAYNGQPCTVYVPATTQSAYLTTRPLFISSYTKLQGENGLQNPGALPAVTLGKGGYTAFLGPSIIGWSTSNFLTCTKEGNIWMAHLTGNPSRQWANAIPVSFNDPGEIDGQTGLCLRAFFKLPQNVPDGTTVPIFVTGGGQLQYATGGTDWQNSLWVGIGSTGTIMPTTGATGAVNSLHVLVTTDAGPLVITTGTVFTAGVVYYLEINYDSTTGTLYAHYGTPGGASTSAGSVTGVAGARIYMGIDEEFWLWRTPANSLNYEVTLDKQGGRLPTNTLWYFGGIEIKNAPLHSSTASFTCPSTEGTPDSHTKAYFSFWPEIDPGNGDTKANSPSGAYYATGTHGSWIVARSWAGSYWTHGAIDAWYPIIGLDDAPIGGGFLNNIEISGLVVLDGIFLRACVNSSFHHMASHGRFNFWLQDSSYMNSLGPRLWLNSSNPGYGFHANIIQRDAYYNHIHDVSVYQTGQWFARGADGLEIDHVYTGGNSFQGWSGTLAAGTVHVTKNSATATTDTDQSAIIQAGGALVFADTSYTSKRWLHYRVRSYNAVSKTITFYRAYQGETSTNTNLASAAVFAPGAFIGPQGFFQSVQGPTDQKQHVTIRSVNAFDETALGFLRPALVHSGGGPLIVDGDLAQNSQKMALPLVEVLGCAGGAQLNCSFGSGTGTTGIVRASTSTPVDVRGIRDYWNQGNPIVPWVDPASTSLVVNPDFKRQTATKNFASDADMTLTLDDAMCGRIELKDTGALLTTGRYVFTQLGSINDSEFEVSNLTAQMLTFCSSPNFLSQVIIPSGKTMTVRCGATSGWMRIGDTSYFDAKGVSGLVLDLDSARSVTHTTTVSGWKDQMGANVHAPTGTQPAFSSTGGLNGWPKITFANGGGNTPGLFENAGPFAAGADRTVYIVFQTNTVTAVTRGNLLTFGATSPSFCIRYDSNGNTDSDETSYSNTSTYTPNNNPHVLAVTYHVGSVVGYYLDNALQAAGAHVAVSDTGANAMETAQGAAANGNWQGDMYRILVYSGVHGADMVAKISRALGAQYRITVA